MRPGEAVTLRQVASHAGVSRQTVSNVLNAPERVDPATLAKVQAAIEALGYQPNRTARSLATKQAGLIGYGLARQAGHSLFMDPFLHAMTESIEQTGRHVLLFTAPAGMTGLQTYADLIAQRAVDAFVLSDTVDRDPRHAWLAERGVPYASFGRVWPATGGQPGPWVDVDGAKACAELVAGLHAKGHTKIGFVGWQAPTAAGRDRQRGWRAACGQLGLDERDCVAVSAEVDSTEGGAQAAATLLDSAVPPTAIVGVSDLLAVGVLNEVRRRGLRAGHDIWVTGFDDSLLADSVGLTSVRQPIAELAATVVRLLETPFEDRGVLLPGELVLRGSAPLNPGTPDISTPDIGTTV